jgi:hypothetical protein
VKKLLVSAELLAASLAALLVLHLGCGSSRGFIEDQHLAWDSPRMRAIEDELQSLFAIPDEQIRGKDGKSKFTARQGMVERLFRQRFSHQDVCELAESCGTLPTRPRGFATHVLEFLVRSLTEWGDRERLVNLLATRCPEYVEYPGAIEFYLAYCGKGLKDPILILGEAYSESQVAETRRALAAAVRRAFAAFPVEGKDDTEYVENAMQWYAREKSHLIANSEYTLNETTNPFGRDCFYHAELYGKWLTMYPLFVEKPFNWSACVAILAVVGLVVLFVLRRWRRKERCPQAPDDVAPT